MNKQQAIHALANHLAILTDYEVLDSNTADTLLSYIAEIIEHIEDDSENEEVRKVIESWTQLKDSKKDKDYGDGFGL